MALRAAAAAAQGRFLTRQLGRRVSVLVERSGRRGHAEDFASIALAQPARPGTIVEATITGVTGDAALAVVTQAEAA